MSENTVKGEIHQLPEAQTFPSGFTKRLCVVKYQSREYENFLAVEFIKDKVDLLNSLQVGQQVTVHYNEPRSNENPNKPGMWFTGVTGWRIEADGQTHRPDDANNHKQGNHPMPQGAGATVQDTPEDTEEIPF
jgi:hypothetical protein